MEAFSLLKFWHITAGSFAPAVPDDGNGTDDEEDSFFDLDLNLPNTNTISKNVDAASSDTDDDHFYDSCKNIPDSPKSKPQSPISFLRSPTKFPVFMLFKKPQFETKQQQQSKRFRVEEVPISSLLSRVSSSRDRKLRRQSSDGGGGSSSSKRFPKEVVQKYLKLIKPLYVRVSKRYTDKMTSSFYDSSTASPSSSPAIAAPRRRSEERHRVAPLRSVTKHLGKCRSASAAVGMAPPAVNRRDDSLLDDGIQSAILHCKRSYDSKRDLSVLSRCVSDPCYYEISIEPYRSSTEETKRSSI